MCNNIPKVDCKTIYKIPKNKKKGTLSNFYFFYTIFYANYSN